MSKQIIQLSSEEALVLFEYLSRSTNSEDFSVQHKSEQTVMESILSILEESMIEPFEADYRDKLKAAQDMLRK